MRKENNRLKSSKINNNRKAYISDEENMFHRFERTQNRRNAWGDTSAVSTNTNTSCQKHCYHQLAERVRELEKEIIPDVRLHPIPPVYSPYSAITPSSNVSGNGFPTYSRPQNFPVNLLSPNTQRYGLSTKVLERAHQIPERFWIDWQQKQMQNRIEELENIKNNLTSPNNVDLTATNRRKSLLSFHNTQRCISLDNETSSSNTDDHSSFIFDQRSIDSIDTTNLNTSSPIQPITPISSVRKPNSTLDRSHLTIFLPFSYTNIPKQPMSTNNHYQFIAKPNLIETKSCASSIEDVAQIDTEVNLLLLSQENQDQTNPLLYSKAIMNRTIQFRSSSIYQNEISADEEMISNNSETDDKQSSNSSTDSFVSARSTFSISVTIALTMAEEHINPKSTSKKKENIRIFIRRKRLLPGILHKSIPSQANSMEQLNSIIEKNSRNKKNIIVVNYKPVFVNSHKQKPRQTNNKSPSTPPNSRRCSMTTPNSNNSKNQQSPSFHVPDVEDPLEFIEMMYQQLFTEDGQLRNDTEPRVLANCVKQIVTQSRRNSMVRRDSISPNMQQFKYSSTSLSSSPQFRRNTFNEGEEQPNTLLQRNRTDNISRRSSKRSSIDHVDHHQQQLHAFLNSYYHHQKRTSTNQTIINNSTSPFSIDDTDNEDLDTFSDLNSYRKTIRNSPSVSIDEDITQTDSKLLSSSGYQSLKSLHPVISQIHLENDHHYCPNCIHTPQITIIPTTSSSRNFLQPVREIFMKYLNFILISKNILLVPLFIFLLRQRSMHLGN